MKTLTNISDAHELCPQFINWGRGQCVRTVFKIGAAGASSEGGWGGPSPPRKKKKRKKERKKENREKREKNKNKRKKGTMNNVKLLHKELFFSNFSIVRWHWKIQKTFCPPRKSWNDAPEGPSSPESMSRSSEGGVWENCDRSINRNKYHVTSHSFVFIFYYRHPCVATEPIMFCFCLFFIHHSFSETTNH